MAIPLTVNGVTFQYPEVNDEDWGQAATGWASAVTALVSNLTSATLPIADDGVIRLGTNDKICWRNTGDTDNACLFIDGSDRLIYDDGIAQKDLGLTGASGNVQHLFPASDNELVRYDGIMGTVIQTSGVFLDDSQNLSGLADVGCATVTATSTISTDGDVIIDAAGTSISLTAALPPIGMILPHYDYSGALVPDTAHWKVCDGSTQVVGGVSRALPDMSNRYLVGFGTEGGADIASDPFATTPVGNASHQANLEHSHTVNSHSHTIVGDGGQTGASGAHTHTVNAHSHAMPADTGSISAVTDPVVAGYRFIDATGPVSSTASINLGDAGSGTTAAEGQHVHTLVGSTGNTSPGTSDPGTHTHFLNNHSHGGATGTDSPGTDNQLSSTADIQPRSIRVRYYMRVK